MIGLFKRLLRFAGEERGRLLASFAFHMLHSFFEMLPVTAVLTVLSALLAAPGGAGMAPRVPLLALGLMLLSVAGRIAFTYLASVKRTLGSFAMCSQWRTDFGEKLKRVPMGYFNSRRLGDITAAVTTTLSDLETVAVTILETVAGGLIHALVIGLWLFFYEWRIALLMLLGLLLSLTVYVETQRAGKRHAPRRQAAQAALVGGILEYIQGMAVVKAFGLSRRSGQTVERVIDESAEANILLERAFSRLAALFQAPFQFVRAAILVLAPYLLFGGVLAADRCLLLLIASFVIYSSVELAGSTAALARVVEASLDRLDAVAGMPLLDETGADYSPENTDIVVEDVSFAYEEREVISRVSFCVPQGTSCAIVGPSGSGKTTLCSLIARFWDVDRGRILLGGRDLRDYSCDSLLKNFAIVFQQVYLFEDTIENNIRFGRPEADREAVIGAAQKACCHDFISALPEGYLTRVGEGGASLSGGERQRISIARAILKDAPIVILDEAMASVDPENERELQRALRELTRDKTLLMIAHRLSSVREADQILVLDKGRVVQRGRHAELLRQEGLYRRFVELREQAIGWRLKGGDPFETR